MATDWITVVEDGLESFLVVHVVQDDLGRWDEYNIAGKTPKTSNPPP